MHRIVLLLEWISVKPWVIHVMPAVLRVLNWNFFCPRNFVYLAEKLNHVVPTTSSRLLCRFVFFSSFGSLPSLFWYDVNFYVVYIEIESINVGKLCVEVDLFVSSINTL